MEQRIAPVLLHITIEMEPEWEEDINNWYDKEHVPELMAVPGFISARRFTHLAGPTDRKPQKYLCIYEIANPQVVLGRSYLTYHTGWKGAPSLRSEWTARSSEHYRTHRSVRRQVFPIHGSYTDQSGEDGRAPEPSIGSNLDDVWKQPIGTAILQTSMTPDPQWEDEILAWNDEQAVPLLMTCPGFISARRFMLAYDDDRGDASVVGHHKYVSIYELEDASAIDSPAYVSASRALQESRNTVPGLDFSSTSVFKQTFPTSGAFEEHDGPRARAEMNAQERETPAP